MAQPCDGSQQIQFVCGAASNIMALEALEGFEICSNLKAL